MSKIRTILIAPANFKGSISPEAAAESIAKGITSVGKNFKTIQLPLSDGGEGFVKSLAGAGNGEIIEVEVTGPLYKKVPGCYGRLKNNTAVVEMALASGLELIKENEKDPWNATTYGTGELILHAINNGAKKVIVGLGGSATNDGGLGMIQALGAKVLDNKGQPVLSGAKGLENVWEFDLSQLERNIEGVEIVAACDVTNPLLGPEGASSIYGPQKGADDAMIEKLEYGLTKFNETVEKQLRLYKAETPGVGAAGGLGFALVVFLRASLRPGFDIVSQVTNLEDEVRRADLIITGEGKIDDQTLQGKTIHRLAQLAKKYEKKLLAIGGVVDLQYRDKFYQSGISDFYAIVDYANGTRDSIENASDYLRVIGKEIAGQHNL
ncbi:MAG: glycerate kinase [Bacteroidota bacterium]